MLLTASPVAADRVVCHCLQVRESQVADCIQTFGFESVPEVKSHCGAGGGCTACHRRIRDLIRAHARERCGAP